MRDLTFFWKQRSGAKGVPLALIILMTAACRLLPVTSPTPTLQPAATPIIIVATPTPLGEDVMGPIDIEEQLITNLYERVSPSVVHITSRVVTMSFFFGSLPSEGTGSGFVIDEEGHIITNYHVIEGAESIEVRFSDETQLPARVVGTDPANDLAVLEPDGELPPLTPLTLGSSADLRVGQRAIAIGNPFGLDRTLTTGVVSALGRPLKTEGDNYIFNVIQTDAAINPGNSGGPLLDSRGRVIGVSTAIRKDAQGIGFAIPVDTVKRVMPALIENGSYPHPWLGLLGYSITSDLAAALGLPVGKGVLVAQLYRGGPAAEAGVHGAQRQIIAGNRRLLIGGDIITAVNGTAIDDWNSLSEFLELNTHVGDTVTLTLVRDGLPLELELTLAAQPR
ncbi:MAG: S1C family serine protease [Anaerolineae bacterium]